MLLSVTLIISVRHVLIGTVNVAANKIDKKKILGFMEYDILVETWKRKKTRNPDENARVVIADPSDDGQMGIMD